VAHENYLFFLPFYEKLWNIRLQQKIMPESPGKNMDILYQYG
jgi:hypothetical protein